MLPATCPHQQDTKIDSATGDDNFEALQKYGQDLTAMAARLDPVIGRDEEVRAGQGSDAGLHALTHA